MRFAAFSLVATSLLAACSGADTNQAAPANNAAADLTPEGPSMAAQLFGGGKAMPLNQQKVLANGVVVTLTSFQAKADESVLGIRINNGADRDVELNWSDKKTFLVAGGQKYFLSPPVENKGVKVTSGSKMEGELVFLGAIPPGSTVTLVVNDGLSDSQYTSTPGISLPLQLTEAAWSDDGSKKNLAAWRSSPMSRERA